MAHADPTRRWHLGKKARGLKGRALAPLIGRLQLSLYVNAVMKRRTKPYTKATYTLGRRNLTRRLHTHLANEPFPLLKTPSPTHSSTHLPTQNT